MMEDNRKVKQVIVFRHDLLKTLRKGKIGAQVAHASLGALLKHFNKDSHNDDYGTKIEYSVSFRNDSILDKWLNGIFTKICLYVENDEELVALYNKITSESDIPCVLITDAGNTEFHGVPTHTCIGIGPYWSDEIDKFTKDLKLF